MQFNNIIRKFAANINEMSRKELNMKARRIIMTCFAAIMLMMALPVDVLAVIGSTTDAQGGEQARRDQYVFVNGRPATSASIAYALREAYQRRAGDARPAAVIFIELPPNQVDVNVHPTKREVRFRDNVAVKSAIMEAIGGQERRRGWLPPCFFQLHPFLN